MTFAEIHNLTHIDPWFLSQIEDLIKQERALAGETLDGLDLDSLRKLKRSGFSDLRLAKLLNTSQTAVRNKRHQLKLHPVYKRVDTCAAEFATRTAYMLSLIHISEPTRPY